MLFAPTTPVITLALLEDQDALQTGRAVQIDIFPSRIVPAEGYSMEEVVLTLIGHAHQHNFHMHWNSHNLNAWSHSGRDAHTITLPIATVYPGAVQAQDLASQAQLRDGAILVRLGTTTITIGTTVYQRAHFSTIGSTASEIHRAVSTLRQDTAIHPVISGIALGYMAKAAPTSMAEDLKIVHALCARAMPLCIESATKSGTAARNHGFELGQRLRRSLLQTWGLRPNTIGAPTGLRTAALFDQLVANAPDPSLHTGAQLYALLQGQPSAPDPHELAGLRAATQSAHQALALKKLGKAVDATIIQGIPSIHLKTGAARKKTA